MTLEIIGIKTNKGYYIADKYDEESRHYRSGEKSRLLGYIINSEKPQMTFDRMWCFVKNEPKSVEKLESQPNINKRYELKDKDLISDKIPEIIPYEDIETEDDCYCDDWIGKYAPYQSLYEYKSDSQPNKKVDVNFNYKTISELNITEIKAPEKFNYTVLRDSNRNHEGKKTLTNESIKHDKIDEIITPSLLIHNKPSIMGSKDVYEILREYIKCNIDGNVARVTSDYNFCFEVQKVTPGVVNDRKIIFEMTHKGENYKGYTPIDDLIADDEKELKNKIDKLCKDTIEKINEPLIICPECKGQGVILKKDD